MRSDSSQRFALGRKRTSERGQAVTELALTAPLLFLLLLGLFELGHGFNSYLTVLASARDGARLYAQNESTTTNPATILTLVDKESARLPTDLPTGAQNCGAGPGVCITPPPYQVSGVNAVKVRVCYNHPLLVGLPGVLPNPMPMCSQTIMRMVD